MRRIPRIGRWLTVLAGRAGRGLQPVPLAASANRAGDSTSADTFSVMGWLSFRRIVDIPFETCVAALDSWQPAGKEGELRIGQSLLRGPVERDRGLGTCQIEVRMARGPLRPPLRMRLDIDRWSPTSAALELIPRRRARPTATYFRAGNRLLDSLTQALPNHVPVQQRLGGVAASPRQRVSGQVGPGCRGQAAGSA